MSAFAKVVQHAREAKLLDSINSTVGWDERTYMPSAAGAYRAEQMTYLSGLIHEHQTSAAYGEHLQAAWEEIKDADPHSDEATIVRVLKRDYEKESRLPKALVEALTKNSVEGQQAWVEARQADNFSLLAPYLENTVRLKREEAEAIGYEECLYDAVLDQYEPGEKTSRVASVFASLRDQLVALIQAIDGSGQRTDASLIQGHYPVDRQREVGRLAAAKVGFDFQRGRLDETDHPFCTELGPHDVRITTRYDEAYFNSAFFGTLHEAGHGIYELGLRREHYGLPPGEYLSMGFHESQSRLYENNVGRSKSFWKFFFPEVQRAFPSTLDGADADSFYRAVNDVRPSLIRVEADEVTYNLHIIVRFELEQELLGGDLKVPDLPDAWNQRYEQFLGIRPPNDSDGVLQDIHWSAALLGYFPTYALGNLYASQLYAQADRDLGGLDAQIENGSFDALRDWLVEKVHRRGKCLTAAELIQDVTGAALSEKPFMRYVEAKMGEIYGL